MDKPERIEQDGNDYDYNVGYNRAIADYEAYNKSRKLDVGEVAKISYETHAKHRGSENPNKPA